MKKIFSFLLILCLVISCLSMVTFTANAAGEQTRLGRRITFLKTDAGNPYPREAANFVESDVVWEVGSNGDGSENTNAKGRITRTYYFVNTGEVQVKFGMGFYAGNRSTTGLDGWESPASTGPKCVMETTIQPNKGFKTSISFDVYRFSDGALVVKIDSASNPSTYNGVKGYAPINTVYMRYNLFSTNGTLSPVGAVVEVFPIDSVGTEPLYVVTDTKNNLVKYENVYEYPVKNVDNGDAENGMMNWSTINGGKTEIVTDPDDSTNHCVKFTPVSALKTNYSSVTYDFGGKIVNKQNDAFKMNGYGPGRYYLSFRYKADIPADYANSTVFQVTLNSRWHMQASNIQSIHPEATYTDNTYTNAFNDTNLAAKKNNSAITMTNEWQTYTGYIDISANWYNMIVELLANSPKKGTEDPLELLLRLDGSSNRAYELAVFNYFIDDVQLWHESELDGLLLTRNTTNYYFRKTGAFTSADLAKVKDGYLNLSYTLLNPNDYAVKYEVSVQGTVNIGGKNTWAGHSSGLVELQPGAKGLFTVNLPVDEDGYVTIAGQKVALTDTFLRFDFGKGDGDYPKDVEAVLLTSDSVLFNPSDNGFSYRRFKLDEQVCDLVGANVDIGSTLTMNYYATVNGDFDSVKMRFTRGEEVTVVDGVLQGNGQYLFAYNDINPQCMADNIQSELLLDDVVMLIKNRYSVKENAMKLYNSSAVELEIDQAKLAQLKTLLADMLCYGAEAQKYMGYNTDTLANAGLTWVTTAYSAPADATRVIAKNDGAYAIKAAGVHLSNVNKVYFRLQLQDLENVVIKLNGEDVTSKLSGGMIYSDDIKATEYGKVFRLTVEKNGAVVSDVSYNLNAFIAQKAVGSTVSDIVKAMNGYGVSAKAYNG